MVKIIYNKIIPIGKDFTVINLFGVLFSKRKLTPIMLNHEQIHTFQIKELGFIFFYIFYILEWIVRLIQFRSFRKAYLNISFEKEAFKNQEDSLYLKSRENYSFLKYLR